MTTITSRASVFSAVSGSWDSTANAVDAGSGTFASWGTGWSDAAAANLETFDFSSIPAGATINSITCKVKHYYSGFVTSVAIQPYVGATAKDSSHDLTLSRSSTNSQTVTLSGLTLADLKDSGFKIRFETGTSSNGAEYLDYIDVTVDYTASTLYTRTAADDISGITDAATQGRVIARTADDDISGITDSAAGQRIKVGAAADDISGATDALAEVRFVTRSGADSATAADALTAAQTLYRTTADDASADDATTRTGVFGRPVAEDISGAADAITGDTAILFRSAAETIADPTDSPASYAIMPRAVGDTAPAVDDGTRLPLVLARAGADTLADPVETCDRSGSAFARAAPDSAPGDDAITTDVAILFRTAADSAPADDAITLDVAVLFRTAAEDASETTDAITTDVAILYRSGADTVAVADAADRSGSVFSRALAAEDLSALTDAATQNANRGRWGTDDGGTGTDDVPTSSVLAIRTAADAIADASDAVTATTLHPRSGADDAPATDDGSRIASIFARAATETITGVTDEMVRSAGVFSRALVEVLPIPQNFVYNEEAAVDLTGVAPSPSFNPANIALTRRTDLTADGANTGYRAEILASADPGWGYYVSFLTASIPGGMDGYFEFQARGVSGGYTALSAQVTNGPNSDPITVGGYTGALTTAWQTYRVPFTAAHTSTEGTHSFRFGIDGSGSAQIVEFTDVKVLLDAVRTISTFRTSADSALASDAVSSSVLHPRTAASEAGTGTTDSVSSYAIGSRSADDDASGTTDAVDEVLALYRSGSDDASLASEALVTSALHPRTAAEDASGTDDLATRSGTFTRGQEELATTPPRRAKILIASRTNNSGTMVVTLPDIGYADVTLNTAVTTVAECSGYDLIVFDDFAWTLAKPTLMASLYDAGYAVLSTANDAYSGQFPFGTSYKGGQAGFGFVPTTAPRYPAQGWNATTGFDTDTGQIVTGVRSSAFVLATWPATLGGTGYTAFGEENPNGLGGRWIHLQPASSTPFRANVDALALLTRVVDWLVSPSAQGIDSPTRATVQPRDAADSAPAVDAATQNSIQSRTAADSAPAADTTTRTGTFGREVADDFSGITDSLASPTLHPRAVTEDISGTDDGVPARAGVFSRDLGDAAPAVDDGVRLPLVLARAATEDLTSLADDAHRSAGVFARSLTDFTLPPLTNLTQYPATNAYVSSTGFGTSNYTATNVAAGSDGYRGQAYRRATVLGPFAPATNTELILHQQSTFGISTLGMTTPVTVGQPYSIAVPVRSSVAQRVRVQAQGITATAGGNSLAGVDVVLTPNVWTLVSVANYVPAGAVVGVRADVDTGVSPIAWAAGDTLDVGRPLVYQSATLSAVLGDGDTAGWQWLGPVEAGLSIGPDPAYDSTNLDAVARVVLQPRTTADDASGTTEASASPTLHPRTTSDDASGTTDAPASYAVLSRTGADTTAVAAEGAAGTSSMARAGADTADVTGDTAARLTVQPRATAEAVTGLTDSPASAALEYRAVTEDVTGLGDVADTAALHYRTGDDAAPIDDSVDRMFVTTADGEDTVGSPTDSIDRSGSIFSRIAADTATAADAVTLDVAVLIRGTADDVSGTSEVAVQNSVQRRTAADPLDLGPGTLDEASSVVIAFRSAADAVDADDGTATRKGIPFARAVTEDVSGIADSSTRAQVLGRGMADSVTGVTETLASPVTAYRTGSDDISGIDDTTSRTGVFGRTGDDAAPADDALAHVPVRVRSAADTGSADDAVDRHGVFARVATDAAPTADDSSRDPITFFRSAADSVAGLTDTAVRSGGVFYRALTDFTSDTPDTAVAITFHARTAADAAPADDTAVRSAGVFGRALTEDISVGVDGTATATTFHACTATDVAPADDLVARVGSTFGRTSAEDISVGVGDVATASTLHPRTAADDVSGAFDTIADVRSLFRTGTDTVPVTETLDSPANRARTTADAAPVASDVADGASYHLRALAEFISDLTDAVLSPVLAPRTAADTVTAPTDTAVKMYRAIKSGADSAPVDDALSRTLLLLRSGTDAVSTTDAVDSPLRAFRSSADVGYVTDDNAVRMVLLPRTAEEAIPEANDALNTRLYLLRSGDEVLAEPADVAKRTTRYFRGLLDDAPTEGLLVSAVRLFRRVAEDAMMPDDWSYARIGTDYRIVPRIRVLEVSRAKVSLRPGYDLAEVRFFFDLPVTAWSVRVNSTSHLDGDLVQYWESYPPTQYGIAAVPAALLRRGANTVTIYGRSLDGVWTR